MTTENGPIGQAIVDTVEKWGYVAPELLSGRQITDMQGIAAMAYRQANSDALGVLRRMLDERTPVRHGGEGAVTALRAALDEIGRHC